MVSPVSRSNSDQHLHGVDRPGGSINSWAALIQNGGAEHAHAKAAIEQYVQLAVQYSINPTEANLGLVVDQLKSVTKGPLTVDFLLDVHDAILASGDPGIDIRPLTGTIVTAYNNSL